MKERLNRSLRRFLAPIVDRKTPADDSQHSLFEETYNLLNAWLSMDADVYERDVLPQLRSAIPKSVGSDHRQALKKRMEFGNEVSFGRRLRTLVTEHEAALAAAVPDPCSWVQTIVDYRNGFTHHPVADEAVPDRDKIELIQCNCVLQILLELCFLKSMTLDAETIAALAKQCDRYRKIRERFFSEDAAKESGTKAQGVASGG